MTYVWLTDLGAALNASGVGYVEVPAHPSDATGASSWRTRGRPEGTGDGFFPDGIVCHHTASPAGTTAATDLRVILSGNGDAPGPISQLYIGRDAVLYLVAAGRANHAGSGMRPGLDFVCTDMNARNVGIEVGNNGVGEPWSDEVCDLYGRTVAALLDWYGWDLGHVYLHNTTGPPSGGCNSKIDPAGPWTRQRDLTSQTWDLGTWHAFVAERQGHRPTPPQPPEDDDMATPVGFITCNAGTVGHHVDGSEWRAPVDGTTFYVTPGGGLQWMRTPEQLATKQSVLAQAGLRTDTWSTPVGDPDVFGLLVGAKP